MTEQELAIETNMRRITSELTKEEGIKLMELLIERTQPQDIADVINLVKIGREAGEIGRLLSKF